MRKPLIAVALATLFIATELAVATQAGSGGCTRAGERIVFRQGYVVVIVRGSRFASTCVEGDTGSPPTRSKARRDAASATAASPT
jgi:hypothetical protein